MLDKKKVEEWASDFKAYVNELDIARDVHRGIMEYIDDAITILRGQNETTNDLPFQRHDCGALIVYRGRDVCPNCGRKVKWYD